MKYLCITLLVAGLSCSNVVTGLSGRSDSTLNIVNSPLQTNEVQDVDWNKLFDALLAQLRQEIVQRQMDTVPVSDIDQDFRVKKRFIKITAHLHADRGYFRHLTTIQRTAPVVVAAHDNVYSITASVGFAVVEMGYEHYRVSVRGIKMGGHIEGHVGANSVQIQVTVTMLPTGGCTVNLLGLRVVQLDDVHLRISGFGFLDHELSKLAEREIGKRKPQIIAQIENKLRETIVKALFKIHC